MRSLGLFVGRRGAYFLKNVSCGRGFSRSNNLSFYLPPPSDAGSFKALDELSLEYLTNCTAWEQHVFPPTINRGAPAPVLAEFTLPPTLRTTLAQLAAQGVLEVSAASVQSSRGINRRWWWAKRWMISWWLPRRV